MADTPPEFAALADAMPPVVRSLLVDSADPSTIHLDALLRELGIGETPASTPVMTRGSALSKAACSQLRAAIDRERTAAVDTVDGAADHQLKIGYEKLEQLIGPVGASTTCLDVPLEFCRQHGGARHAPLIELLEGWKRARERAGSCDAIDAGMHLILRRYTADSRPWIPLHADHSTLTVNVALSDDAQVEGGRLVAVVDGQLRALPRTTGDAVVHDANLLHGVTRVVGGARYSLVIFIGKQSQLPPTPSASEGAGEEDDGLRVLATLPAAARQELLAKLAVVEAPARERLALEERRHVELRAHAAQAQAALEHAQHAERAAAAAVAQMQEALAQAQQQTRMAGALAAQCTAAAGSGQVRVKDERAAAASTRRTAIARLMVQGANGSSASASASSLPSSLSASCAIANGGSSASCSSSAAHDGSSPPAAAAVRSEAGGAAGQSVSPTPTADATMMQLRQETAARLAEASGSPDTRDAPRPPGAHTAVERALLSAMMERRPELRAAGLFSMSAEEVSAAIAPYPEDVAAVMESVLANSAAGGQAAVAAAPSADVATGAPAACVVGPPAPAYAVAAAAAASAGESGGGSWRVGDRVRVHGLVAAAQHNGKCGVLTGGVQANGRAQVKLDDGTGLLLKPSNWERSSSGSSSSREQTRSGEAECGGAAKAAAAAAASSSASSGQHRGEPAARHATAAMAARCAGRIRTPLDAHDYVVLDDVLSADAVASLRGELQTLGRRLGGGARTDTHAAGTRTDRAYYLNEEVAASHGLPAVAAGVKALKALGAEVVGALGGACGALTLPRNVQAACYAGDGGYYRMHTDNSPVDYEKIVYWPPSLREQLNAFELRSWRVYTVILYANDGWQRAHAGCLRVHHEAGGHADLEPLGGRAVVFNSLLAHEVRPAHERERWALTLWVWREDGDERKYFLS